MERIKEDILALAEITDPDQPGFTRRPFTEWHLESRRWLKERMAEAGLTVCIDAASNMIGIQEGQEASLPPIVIGSHTDSVAGGGRFDGVAGVVTALEVARRLKEEGVRLRHPLQVIDFTGEESSEFGISTIGSRGFVGNLTEEVLGRTDRSGMTLRNGIRKAGGRPEQISEQAKKKGDVALYLELHIEQGPVLIEQGLDLGIVTGIVGIRRHRILVSGQPNHAGTTPMPMRQDALPAASEIVLAVERVANGSYSSQVVGTVGVLDVRPNSANVIPGEAELVFEVRTLENDLLDRLVETIRREAESIAQNRGCRIEMSELSRTEPIRMEEWLVEGLEKSAKKTGGTVRLPSGAGHDANQLARIAPAGMLFVPSKDAKSHCPEEWTDFEQIEKGVEAIRQAVLRFDRELD